MKPNFKNNIIHLIFIIYIFFLITSRNKIDDKSGGYFYNLLSKLN